MKIGDVVASSFEGSTGVVVDVPVARHSKQVQKVVVLDMAGNLSTWVAQYCKVLSK